MQKPVKSNYREIRQSLPGIPLFPVCKLPTIGKLTIKDFQVGADGFAGSWNFTGICISLYSFVPIIIYLFPDLRVLWFQEKIAWDHSNDSTNKKYLINAYIS